MSNQNFRLIMSVSFQGKRIIYYTGLNCAEHEWDRTKQRFNAASLKFYNVNAYLDNLKRNAVYICYSLSIKDGTPNSIDVRQQLKKYRISPGHDFFEAFLDFLEQNLEEWADLTYRKLKSLYHHLISFRDVYPGRISLESVDKDFYRHFSDHLRNKSLGFSTIKSYLQLLKWFLNWCHEKKMMINTAFRVSFKDFTKEPENYTPGPKLFLIKEELNLLRNVKIADRKVKRIADIYCFMAYSGLRYNEVLSLEKEDVSEKTIRVRGNKFREVPVNGFIQEIIQQYENSYFKNNTFFPVFSVITANKYLRKLFKQLNLNREVRIKRNGKEINQPLGEVITINSAYNSFLANSIFLDLPFEVIRKWTGSTSRRPLMQLEAQIDQLEEISINRLNHESRKN